MTLAGDSVRQSSDNKNNQRIHMEEKKMKKKKKNQTQNQRETRRLLPFLPFSQLQNTVSSPPPKMC